MPSRREFIASFHGRETSPGIFRPSFFFVLCGVVVVFMCGCGRDHGPERAVVSGSITYQGVPIARGIIRFLPVSNSSAPSSAAEIIDGRYRADARGGVPVGTHTISIEAYRVTSPSDSDQPPRFAPPPNFLPKQYNVDSRLRMTIEPGSGDVAKNFDLI